MKPNKKFKALPKHFWAHIKLLSEDLGYSGRGTGTLKHYSEKEIKDSMTRKGLSLKHLAKPVRDGKTYLSFIIDYLNYRSKCLIAVAKPNLMNRNQAKKIFKTLKKKLKPKCKLPMNKQKGKKKHYAYLTCIINMLTEHYLKSKTFDQDPYSLAVAIKNRQPVRTFTRRFDGAFPGVINPKAVWEIKEYYGTTTFGSRVADGIYESILDGQELQELAENEGIKIMHYLIVDDYFTWWALGKSYLCRMVDMLHMGYVDEVLFGREAVREWPKIVRSWQ